MCNLKIGDADNFTSSTSYLTQQLITRGLMSRKSFRPAGSKHAILNDGDKKLVFFFAYPKPWYKTTLLEEHKPDMGE